MVMPESGRRGRSRLLGIFSTISGILSILLLIVFLSPAPTAPSQLLTYVTDNGTLYVLVGAVVTTWTVFSIPFVVALGDLLKPRDSTVAKAATFLSAGGILLLGWGIYNAIAALLSITAAAAYAPNQAEAVYQVAIWSNLEFSLTDPGLMIWGLGQLLFGWLAWKSNILPNWLAILGIIGGLSGLFTHAVYQTPVLAFVTILVSAVWGLKTGQVLFTRKT